MRSPRQSVKETTCICHLGYSGEGGWGEQPSLPCAGLPLASTAAWTARSCSPGALSLTRNTQLLTSDGFQSKSQSFRGEPRVWCGICGQTQRKMPFLPTDLWDGGGAEGVFTDIRPEIYMVGWWPWPKSGLPGRLLSWKIGSEAWFSLRSGLSSQKPYCNWIKSSVTL